MPDNTPKNSPARLKANAKYLKEKYVQICFAIPKDAKEYYRSEATKLGYTSLNAFIRDAIEEKIERGVK